MPFIVLLLAMFLLPTIELSVMLRVADAVGSWNTVALVILTAVVGISLVKSQGLSTLMSMQRKLSQGEAPGLEIVEGMLLAVGGILLVVPGFVTDFIGVILLTPVFRRPIAALMLKRMQLKVVMSPPGKRPFDNARAKGKGDVFEGEYEHKPDSADAREARAINQQLPSDEQHAEPPRDTHNNPHHCDDRHDADDQRNDDHHKPS